MQSYPILKLHSTTSLQHNFVSDNRPIVTIAHDVSFVGESFQRQRCPNPELTVICLIEAAAPTHFLLLVAVYRFIIITVMLLLLLL